jgi:hypothetical protein
MASKALRRLFKSDSSSGKARLVVLVALVLGTVRLIEATPLSSANDRSRWATVWSLVELRTSKINEIRKYPGWDTIDKVKVGDDFYSSKPPILSAVVAGGYSVLRKIPGWRIDPANAATMWPASDVLLFLLNIVPTALALGAFTKLLYRHADIGFTRNYLLVAACFGTLWSAYLPSLNNHVPAVCCVMFALRAAVVTVPASLSLKRVAFAGLMAGCATALELPALAFLAGLFVILLKFAPRRTLLGFLPAAAIPLAAFLISQKLATGSWTPFYASFDKPGSPYLYVEDGVPSYWMEPKGLDAGKDPFYTYLFHCVLGHHGLISLTPILLLSFFGLLRYRKWQFSPLNVYYLLGALLTAVVFGFYLRQTDSWNYGGVSVGLRWMLWLIPFWLLMMIPAVDKLSGNRVGQALLLLLLAPSVFSAWHPFDGPWKQPWIFQALDRAGRLPQYRDDPKPFEHPRRSWISQLPTSAEADSKYWVELSGVAVDGGALTLRISDGGPGPEGRGRRVEFHWNAGSRSERRTTLVMNVEAVTEGEPDDLLFWPEGEPAAAMVQEAYDLVHGVPVNLAYVRGEAGNAEQKQVRGTMAYRRSRVRYQRFGLRKDAFKCDHAWRIGAQQTRAPGIPLVKVYSECWNTPEVPFGIVLWDVQTLDNESGVQLAERRMTVSSVGKYLEPPARAVTE